MLKHSSWSWINFLPTFISLAQVYFLQFIFSAMETETFSLTRIFPERKNLIRPGHSKLQVSLAQWLHFHENFFRRRFPLFNDSTQFWRPCLIFSPIARRLRTDDLSRANFPREGLIQFNQFTDLDMLCHWGCEWGTDRHFSSAFCEQSLRESLKNVCIQLKSCLTFMHKNAT